MEVLNLLLMSQNEFEDALRLESTPEEVMETKDGKKLVRWIKHRRRVINCISGILKKM